ncbi:hypothetical protein GWI33_016329 [Rhynchophorus ferrugineus]|uniref:Uncharacterized protein n=1 Tax=Rhynchophorus ferrugineus TaxID=354439 RepID=A0A834IBE5_RHYFE|nr:hypothetical protein GWI33_016329 [Rhynchophorus ferrugineus]
MELRLGQTPTLASINDGVATLKNDAASTGKRCRRHPSTGPGQVPLAISNCKDKHNQVDDEPRDDDVSRIVDIWGTEKQSIYSSTMENHQNPITIHCKQSSTALDGRITIASTFPP